MKSGGIAAVAGLARGRRRRVGLHQRPAFGEKYLAPDLYATATIPQATLTLESGIAAYETGGIDFLMLLDDLKTLFTYELGYYEQLANLEKAIAMIEPLVGRLLR